jgi:hypothetical protein
MPQVWKPLLTGELAARARESVTAIARDLAAPPHPAGDAFSLWEGEGRGRLSGGAPGPALLFGYLARSGEWHPERAGELAEHYLDEAAETLATVPMSPGLFGGFTGVAWTSQHLRRLLGAEEEEEECDAGAAAAADSQEDLDRALLAALAQEAWPGDFDLVRGLAGLGVYALERLPRPTALRCLVAVVDRLEQCAEAAGEGIAWRTRAELMAPHHRAEEPLGVFNLGVAHGVPGVLALLAAAGRIEPCAPRARALLAGAVGWLRAVPRLERGGPRFGQWVSPRTGLRPARRLAWCYGDPGVAATLLSAARAAGETGWEREALEIAREAAQVPLAESGVVDAALCHGATGVAHLYNRIYQATGEDLFATAARLWFERALALRRPGEGIGGFCAPQGLASPAVGWGGDPGLITGAAGVGLALLAAIGDLEPGWDRLLRVAIPGS